ncbi:type II toxin-antitoxin system MqsA family antitoxin [Methanolobus bombayensis]|uniref:type II toxin-antitoxin system MqsA family antitoxin n=1 Tax=Methanolobus bombayensis TaxID=38023 RepID=UPI001AE75DD9|nr:type II toxin-antitoxin system MqsA family antitoxin [Methanolobus bombayensis]MBP1910667.1 YgiT-type zinc finger domain-containing protein [Methanolobus bombayensis]
MIPDKCSFCKGKLIEGKHEFVVKIGETVLAIRDVDAFICQECGEAYYTPETSRRIDKIMQKFYDSSLRVHPLAA